MRLDHVETLLLLLLAVASCIIYRSSLKLSFNLKPTAFEVVAVHMLSASAKFVFVAIYRSGSQAVRDILFFTELTNLLESLAVYSCDVVLTGILTFMLMMVRRLTLLTLLPATAFCDVWRQRKGGGEMSPELSRVLEHIATKFQRLPQHSRVKLSSNGTSICARNP